MSDNAQPILNVPIPEQKEGLPFHHASTSAPHLNGQFARKLDPAEQQRLSVMFANLSKQASQIVSGLSNVTQTLPAVGADVRLADGSIDLKSIPTLYLKALRGCTLTVAHRTTKVMIEDCQDTSVHFTAGILTSTLEAWKCRELRIHSEHSIRTMQLDLNHTVRLCLPDVARFGNVVWNSCEALSVHFDSSPERDISTGYTQMLAQYPDSQLATDQFIIRCLDGASLTTERCIRLNNGFLSTEREAVEWDKKAELAKERYVQHFMKNSGITIRRKQEKATPPNDPCPCGSGKKYKKVSGAALPSLRALSLHSAHLAVSSCCLPIAVRSAISISPRYREWKASRRQTCTRSRGRDNRCCAMY